MYKSIPQEVKKVLHVLNEAGHEAFVVGGCVRDIHMKRQPKDWDITTKAQPDEVQALFSESFYENNFGTVGVKVAPFLPHGKTDREYDIVEVTTYRTESIYSDNRRPDDVAFVESVYEDLARRDFTMNAMAMDANGNLKDPFDGVGDIQKKIIRAVGDADTRFKEDALRMMRAVRFAAELGFDIEQKTVIALKNNAGLITKIAMERIRDEFSRIVMSQNSRHGIQMLSDVGMLRHIMPELERGIGVEQNHHHIYDVWEHNLRALETCPSTKLSVRLGALLHDVGKPAAKEGHGRECTFYNHEYIGERMTKKILRRMKYPKKVTAHAALLVRNHMFYYSVDEVTESAVRRIISRVGRENMKDLIDVRIGDRLGSGSAKAKPYKLRHFEYMVEKVSHDAVSVKMLKIDGNILIKEMGFSPGPKIGAILETLLAEVIDDPSRNTQENLKERALQLVKQDIEKLRSDAKKRIALQRKKDEEQLKKRYWVK